MIFEIVRLIITLAASNTFSTNEAFSGSFDLQYVSSHICRTNMARTSYFVTAMLLLAISQHQVAADLMTAEAGDLNLQACLNSHAVVFGCVRF